MGLYHGSHVFSFPWLRGIRYNVPTSSENCSHDPLWVSGSYSFKPKRTLTMTVRPYTLFHPDYKSLYKTFTNWHYSYLKFYEVFLYLNLSLEISTHPDVFFLETVPVFFFLWRTKTKVWLQKFIKLTNVWELSIFINSRKGFYTTN